MNTSLDQNTEDAICDDARLIKRIKNVVMGDVHPDPVGETTDEQSQFILKTIARQLNEGQLSITASRFLAYCFDRYLSGDTASLDQAFYIHYPKSSGGQSSSDKKKRLICRAYRTVIFDEIRTYEEDFPEPLWGPVSRELQERALHAAYLAWRECTPRKLRQGNDNTDEDIQKKIIDSVIPILLEQNVYMQTQIKGKSKKKGISQPK